MGSCNSNHRSAGTAGMSDRLLENKKEMMLDELFGVKRNIQSIGRVLRGSIMGKSATAVYIDEHWQRAHDRSKY